jgi:hypothetical protein
MPTTMQHSATVGAKLKMKNEKLKKIANYKPNLHGATLPANQFVPKNDELKDYQEDISSNSNQISYFNDDTSIGDLSNIGLGGSVYESNNNFDSRFLILRSNYTKSKGRAYSLANSPSVPIHRKIQCQSATKIYAAISNILYATISLMNIDQLEAYVVQRGTHIPNEIFDLSDWSSIIATARECRGYTDDIDNEIQELKVSVTKATTQAFETVKSSKKEIFEAKSECKKELESFQKIFVDFMLKMDKKNKERSDASSTKDSELTSLLTTLTSRHVTNEWVDYTKMSLDHKNAKEVLESASERIEKEKDLEQEKYDLNLKLLKEKILLLEKEKHIEVEKLDSRDNELELIKKELSEVKCQLLVNNSTLSTSLTLEQDEIVKELNDKNDLILQLQGEISSLNIESNNNNNLFNEKSNESKLIIDKLSNELEVVKANLKESKENLEESNQKLLTCNETVANLKVELEALPTSRLQLDDITGSSRYSNSSKNNGEEDEVIRPFSPLVANTVDATVNEVIILDPNESELNQLKLAISKFEQEREVNNNNVEKTSEGYEKIISGLKEEIILFKKAVAEEEKIIQKEKLVNAAAAEESRIAVQEVNDTHASIRENAITEFEALIERLKKALNTARFDRDRAITEFNKHASDNIHLLQIIEAKDEELNKIKDNYEKEKEKILQDNIAYKDSMTTQIIIERINSTSSDLNISKILSPRFSPRGLSTRGKSPRISPSLNNVNTNKPRKEFTLEQTVKLQSIVRGFNSRCRVNKILHNIHANNQGIILATNGTKQGETGWYTLNKLLFYFVLDETGNYNLLCGPVSMDLYNSVYSKWKESIIIPNENKDKQEKIVPTLSLNICKIGVLAVRNQIEQLIEEYSKKVTEVHDLKYKLNHHLRQTIQDNTMGTLEPMNISDSTYTSGSSTPNHKNTSKNI